MAGVQGRGAAGCAKPGARPGAMPAVSAVAAIASVRFIRPVLRFSGRLAVCPLVCFRPSCNFAAKSPEGEVDAAIPPPKTPMAVLDLGTNNCRLLIAVADGYGNFKVQDSFSRIVRLGEGVEASGMISEAAMIRT